MHIEMDIINMLVAYSVGENPFRSFFFFFFLSCSFVTYFPQIRRVIFFMILVLKSSICIFLFHLLALNIVVLFTKI